MYYTKTQLYKQLEQINAPRKSVVMVHSSLRAVGDTEGRGEGLLEVLVRLFYIGRRSSLYTYAHVGI